MILGIIFAVILVVVMAFSIFMIVSLLEEANYYDYVTPKQVEKMAVKNTIIVALFTGALSVLALAALIIGSLATFNTLIGND